MIEKRIQDKGVLAILLEKCIRILLIKECKKISNIKIDIISSSTQIIKGEIQKITIIAENINYKDLLFDKLKLEANNLKIMFKLTNKELYFMNNPLIKFNISLSQNSIRTVLLSDNWNWIGKMICMKILNKKKLEDIKISNGKLLIKASEEKTTINQGEQINIKTAKGKIYLGNKIYTKTIQIPIEDKIYIESVNIENDIINIFANSTISF
ncbi:hypothetical protein [Prochlorococcus marinus]|uniref:hypothetical protein n=1 Tax=Prochlorococcus marinus TaxID=1219 RepID=UPI0022B51B50|nr:hypothetical protein [Prochlorococcus marinus]